jgi:hypothetical protein
MRGRTITYAAGAAADLRFRFLDEVGLVGKFDVGADAGDLRGARAGESARAAARLAVAAVTRPAAIPEAFVIRMLARIFCHGGDCNGRREKRQSGIDIAIRITVTKEVSMVDNLNPTNQFHPYQRPEIATSATPAQGGLMGMLNKLGLNTGSLGSLGDSLKNVGSHPTVTKARDYARGNPGMVLGGLAAAVIGAGLLRKRGMRMS